MFIVSTITPSKEIQKQMHRAFPDHEFIYQEKWTEEGLRKADILITYGEDLTERDIETAVNLKWIMVMSAGLELMPFKAIEKHGILVTNARGIHKIPMAEYTIGMLLQYEKKFKLLIENEKAQIWDHDIEVGELNGKTMLILGTGAIGSEIARLAQAFQMKTMGVNRSGRQVENINQLYRITELDKALPEADYVVSVLPSTEETRNLLQKEHFEWMKDSAVFINLGRGDLVKEDILLDALQNHKIAHAILDVFDSEPVRKGHPFWQMDNVSVTPHLSSRSGEYLPRTFGIFEQNLREYISQGSDFINIVDPSRGY